MPKKITRETQLLRWSSSLCTNLHEYRYLSIQQSMIISLNIDLFLTEIYENSPKINVELFL